MSEDRTVRFRVGGADYALCFTQRARKALQEQHGLWRVSELLDALQKPKELEVLLLAGLEGHRVFARSPRPPFTLEDAEVLLDQASFETVRGHVDQALLLSYLGPKPPAESEGGKAVPPAETPGS